VLKVFNSRGEMIYSDSGYLLSLKNGTAASSNFLNPQPKFSIKSENNNVTIEVFSFLKINKLAHPLRFSIIPLRIFNIILGRFTPLARLFGKMVKKVMIQKIKLINLSLIRYIQISQDSIIIKDTLLNQKFYSIRDIDLGGSNISLHTPSANYFIASDLVKNALDFTENIKELNTGGETHIHKEFRF
jgi:hypothetical protein